jgi:hypothetical protein
VKIIDSPDFVHHPVIRMDMSLADESSILNDLVSDINDILLVNAERHNVSLRGSNPAASFTSNIRDIRKASGRTVVILIDEYDAPVIGLVRRYQPDENLIQHVRTVMQRLYSRIKAASEHIEFVFITGVTKFSRMGVFSKLNNLIEISTMPDYAEFMGYTKTELERNFSYSNGNTANKLNMA